MLRNNRLLIATILAFAMLAGSSTVNAQASKTAKCELTVKGKKYINGPCAFTPLGGGDFMIQRGEWFAYVYLHDENRLIADGYWNDDGGYPANHAHSPLGELIRYKECWLNKIARVCAK